MDEFSLLDVALIASGVNDSAELGHYRDRMAAWAGELKQIGGADGSPRRQVEAIFTFLHGKILKGKYDIQCTDLRQALDEGRFNCVSATVLFNCLAGEMGFSCSGLETPGHVLSRVFLPDGQLDVETTCPRWFCMQHDRLLNNMEGKGTGPFLVRSDNRTLHPFENALTPSPSPKGRGEVLLKPSNSSPDQPTVGARNGEILLKPLSENRDSSQKMDAEEKVTVSISLHENRDSPQKTIGQKPDNDKAKLREISPIQLTAMIYYNRGIDFLAEKRFADAAAANAKALRLDPQSSTARGNFLATINNWAIDLGNAGDYARAADLLRQGLAIDPHYEAFSLNFVHVHHQWSQELCKEGKYAEAVEVLKQAASEMPENAYFQHAVWEVYRNWAIAMFKANKMDEAFDILGFMN